MKPQVVFYTLYPNGQRSVDTNTQRVWFERSVLPLIHLSNVRSRKRIAWHGTNQVMNQVRFSRTRLYPRHNSLLTYELQLFPRFLSFREQIEEGNNPRYVRDPS